VAESLLRFETEAGWIEGILKHQSLLARGDSWKSTGDARCTFMRRKNQTAVEN
jgi:hypothetical protein